MDGHDQEVRKILSLTQENNEILRKMNRRAKWGSAFRILYWTFFIGTALGTYYFLQPFFDSFKDILGSISGGAETLKELGGQTPGIGSILQNLGR